MEKFPFISTKWKSDKPYPEGDTGVATVVGFKTIVVYTITFGDKTYELERELNNFQKIYGNESI